MKLKVISAQYRFCDTPDHKEGMVNYHTKLPESILVGDVITSEDDYPNEIWFFIEIDDAESIFTLKQLLGHDLIVREDATLQIYDDYLE